MDSDVMDSDVMDNDVIDSDVVHSDVVDSGVMDSDVILFYYCFLSMLPEWRIKCNIKQVCYYNCGY